MSEKAIFELDGGVAKILYIYEDRCVLAAQKNGMSFLTGNLFAGNKEFYYENLTSVQFKPASAIINGFLQFEFPGSHGSGNNHNSENSFAYQKRKIDNDTMEKAINYIRNKIKEAKKPATVTTAVSAADELKKFKDLMDAGIITQAEFDEKKKQLLGL